MVFTCIFFLGVSSGIAILATPLGSIRAMSAHRPSSPRPGGAGKRTVPGACRSGGEPSLLRRPEFILGSPTPAISSTGLATPTGPEEATSSEQPQATPQPKQVSMFQPVVLDMNTAFQATALSMGVDTQDTAATQAWMATPLTTRKDVLETIRHYHTAVVRPELYNMINQVEATLLRFDDRVLRNLLG